MTIEYLTAILIFITAIYVYLTHKIARASEASVKAIEEQSEAFSRPYVSVTIVIRQNSNILYLYIQNIGKTAAINLRLTIDKDFYMWGEKRERDNNLASRSAFTETIDSLAPGAELRFPLAQGFVIFGDGMTDEICPKQFKVTAKYEFGSKSITEVNPIDLRCYLGTSDYADAIPEELEKIRKAIEQRQ